jgi:hypothetical protein
MLYAYCHNFFFMVGRMFNFISLCIAMVSQGFLSHKRVVIMFYVFICIVVYLYSNIVIFFISYNSMLEWYCTFMLQIFNIVYMSVQ